MKIDRTEIEAPPNGICQLEREDLRRRAVAGAGDDQRDVLEDERDADRGDQRREPRARCAAAGRRAARSSTLSRPMSGIVNSEGAERAGQIRSGMSWTRAGLAHDPAEEDDGRRTPRA